MGEGCRGRRCRGKRADKLPQIEHQLNGPRHAAGEATASKLPVMFAETPARLGGRRGHALPTDRLAALGEQAGGEDGGILVWRRGRAGMSVLTGSEQKM